MLQTLHPLLLTHSLSVPVITRARRTNVGCMWVKANARTFKLMVQVSDQLAAKPGWDQQVGGVGLVHTTNQTMHFTCGRCTPCCDSVQRCIMSARVRVAFMGSTACSGPPTAAEPLAQ